mmetsp:Transcript_64625/g.159086  ORF Transcript_64625/g.159086 Transcript_64625/m.159086 type:complete len:97 (+) Transcript_64625:147-437(+)
MGGWWPFGGGGEKPNMSANSRVTCYDNRDVYFECLEQNGEGSDKCKALEGKYRTACLPAWQKYFDMQRKTLQSQGKPWKSPNMEGEKGTLKPVRPP